MLAACLRSLFVWLAAYLSFGALDAHACSATAQDVFLVGDKSTDSACNYSTIQAAVNAATCAAGTKIFLTDEVDYTEPQIAITNKNISLIGRPAGARCGTLSAVCGTLLPCPTAPLETIYGNIKIRGTSNVTIQYLDITGGHGAADNNGTTYGGGIDYAATGVLHLYTSTIEHNTADNGGGIRFQGYNGVADLYLHSHTQIGHNAATNGGSGGGIRVEGDATVHADEPFIWIHDNLAADKGGGMIVIGPASAHIGSTGDVFFGSPVGVVSYNTANYGGGIAVFANSSDGANADASIIATDPGHPVRIENNRAYQTGGGIYLKPWTGFDSGFAFASAQMGGARIDGNAAREGSGIYIDTDSIGGIAYFEPGHCVAGIECNTVSNNRAVATDAMGNETATAGSAILIQTYGDFTAQQLVVRGNKGAHAIRVADSLSNPLFLDTCLFAGNTVTGELITTGNASATFTQCTFAKNTIGAPAVLLVAANFSLTNSIFMQPPLRAVEWTTKPNLTLDYILAYETDISLSGGQHILYGSPAFVDPANGDFHLAANSPAIDKAPPVAGDDRDLDNQPRDQDLLGVANLDGDRDLGAYERQPTACDAGDTIFCNSFDGA
ncbi:MAG TPA: hypothetical protein VHQ21_06040 [Rhodanobacteraceae bacterium]|jgi:hypothetical protein|nr:hypothetical protein [Rhodanobacteraceae bacterium]